MITLWLIPTALSVTFEEAVAEALRAGPAAAAVAAERSIAVGEARASATLLEENPTVSVDSDAERTEAVSVALPIAGQSFARLGAAAAERDAALLRATSGEVEVAADAAVAYLDAVRAMGVAERAEASADLARRSREAALRLQEAGEMSPVDRAVAESLAVVALTDASRAQQDALATKMRLETRLGRPPTGTIEVAGWPNLAEPEPVGADATPAVRAEEAAARSARARRTLAAMDVVPSPEVGVGRYTEGSESGLAWSVGLEIPLAPGAGEVSAARGRLALADAELQRIRLETAADLSVARAELDAARSAWEVTRIEGLDQALGEVGHAFEVGEIGLLDYALRREAILEALVRAIDARHRLEVARVELWRLSGHVPEVEP